MKELLVIDSTIKTYSEDKEDLTLLQIQELKDDLSVALYLMSENYADCKLCYDVAKYYRGVEVAKNMREVLSEAKEGNIKMTQREAEGIALERSEKEFKEEHIADRDFEHIRKIYQTSENVLNSMATRIKIILNEQRS